MNRLDGWMVALLMGASATAGAALPDTLRACGDVAEFPPFSYYQRANGKKTREVTGFDLDVLRFVAREHGMQLVVDLLPWPRCLAMATRGGYEVVLDGIKSPTRERDFLFPPSHYSLTPIFLYLTTRPKPDFSTKERVAKLRICSQADYNYEPYGVPNALVSNRARTIEDAAQMMKLGRCDVMINVLENLHGYATVGGIDLLSDKNFAYGFPTWLSKIDFYFMVGRSVPQRAALIAAITHSVDALRKSGELERLRQRHMRP